MKYEYKIVTIETSRGLWSQGQVDEEEILKMMRDLAKKDWEFVSATPIARHAFFRQPGITDNILFFFKRQKKSLITKKLKE